MSNRLTLHLFNPVTENNLFHNILLPLYKNLEESNQVLESVQEMSASVNDYSHKIKEMTGYLEKMEKLVSNFKENYNNYHM